VGLSEFHGGAHEPLSDHLKMQTEVMELIEENGVVNGVRAMTRDGALEIPADLTRAGNPARFRLDLPRPRSSGFGSFCSRQSHLDLSLGSYDRE